MQKGSRAAPLLAALLSRFGSAQKTRMFRERRAPQKRCVQLWFGSKPGGVMSPPELLELTSNYYAAESRNASEEMEKLRYPQLLKIDEIRKDLLDEKRFAELVAADERLHGAIAAEEILDFAILVDLLRRAKHCGGDHLQCV
jgi:hypothetical protein